MSFRPQNLASAISRHALFRLSGLALVAIALAGCEGVGAGDQGSVSLYWSPPFERVNGEPLHAEDIKGYSIRYRHPSESQFTSVFVPNDGLNSLHLDQIESPGVIIFQIATIDKNGLYSDFVTAAR